MSSSGREFPFKRASGSRVGNEMGAYRLYDQKSLHINLRQWRMLHAVIDCNGFTGAGQHLHLSQSAISYSIAKLQEQLGLPLLKIEGRKAFITEDGRILLDRSRNLIREAIELELLAESLRNGWGTRVHLEVDRNFPNVMLMSALRQFQADSSQVGVALQESDATRAEEALCDHGADLAIVSDVPPGHTGLPLMNVEYVSVAHPEHPLFKLQRHVRSEDLDGQVEVVLSSSPMARPESARRLNSRALAWNVSEFDTALGVLRERLAYGWLPRHRVSGLLADNQLRVLPMHGAVQYAPLHLVYGRMARFNRAATRLADVLCAASGRPGAAMSLDEPVSEERRQDEIVEREEGEREDMDCEDADCEDVGRDEVDRALIRP
ncbi:MAG: LysR family transcriptional regulator [Paucimonas sp.]|nr:LysR family transcriptional regulator [Paucimonas sp.]